MANSTVILRDIAIGDSEHLYFGTFTPSASYPNTGSTVGEVVNPSGNTHFSVFMAQAPGYVCFFNEGTQELRIFRNKNPADAGGADIAFPMVANAVDLSGVAFTFIAIGA